MSEDEEALQPSSYRPVKPIPFELVQHSGIFLEEKLYTQALDLLLNILTSATDPPTPIFVPLPQHLAVAVTFLVHPSTTTRAKTAEEADAPPAALRLLRLTNTLAGPVSANFARAFSFTHFESSRRGGRRRNEQDSSEEWKPLNLELGQSAAVWSRAEDFWHAVGWAFNCSVLHKERWVRWQTWLEFMCEVLEDDWAERVRLDAAAAKREEGGDGSKILHESLIVRYIGEGSAGSGKTRRIMKAIFADGDASSVSLFREVFHKELKRPKREAENVKKREVEVNIDQEEYGDYLANDNDDDDDDDDAGVTPQDETDPTAKTKRPTRQSKRPRRGTRSKKDPDADSDAQSAPHPHGHGNSRGVDHLGGLPSLALRQRLLHLLSTVSQRLPSSFINLEELYHLFVENIRHLPLPTFQALVSPTVLPHFSAAATTTLCEFLLFQLRESAAAATDEVYLSQNKLETCFLPYAASTGSLVDNTKMSIALESLLILLDNSGLLTVTPELKDAVDRGIEARAEKVQSETKRNRKVEVTDWYWLLESGERLRILVDVLLPASGK